MTLWAWPKCGETADENETQTGWICRVELPCKTAACVKECKGIGRDRL